MPFSRLIRVHWRLAAFAIAAGCACVSLTNLRPARADNPPGDAIGAIEGAAISVQGPMSMDTTNGQIKTMLRSGSEVQVKSGQAHIDLVEGGNITICGPSHFSVLKSGSSLTIALDSGTVHAHIEGQLTLTVYTAQIQAHAISIGNGAQDMLVGLDASGTMCIHPNRGAVRIEQQLTGQSLLIPQSGEVSLSNGQLETLHNSSGQCGCELQLSAKPAEVSTQVSALASTEEMKQRAAADPPAKTPAAPKEEPVYQVFMPPLKYDASAKVQQDYDPNLIVLVRRARVRPTLIFQGKVEGDPVVAQVAAPAAPPAMQRSEATKKPADDTTWNRVRTFFHKLWSPSS
ncbi:MAG TPA: hypothetical protein VMH20_06020 [Verrucomicrobiae bacterium]|nr:hypothetical protein [Verrucomicrobiae bacterium]